MRNQSPLLLLLFLFSLFSIFLYSKADPVTTGYNCTRSNQTTSPCQTYVLYRAMAPNFTDLASIADLFSVSRLMISTPSNISSPSSPLVADQRLFVPITCDCNQVPNDTRTISYANITFTIKKGDTFWLVSSQYFQNLTTFNSVEIVNPTLVATNLTIGVIVVFPIFCKCPNRTQQQNQVNHLVSYVFQPSDNISTVASFFGVQTKAITDFNGENIQPYDTIFVPVRQLPVLSQPTVVPSPPPGEENDDNTGAVVGLGIGLGIAVVFLVLVGGVWLYREKKLKKERALWGDEEKQKGGQFGKGLKGNSYRKGGSKEMEVSLMADVSGCLDKYRVFGIDELEEATDGFHENCLIQGSVYKGSVDGEVYAIKKMNWNACEELKILQKVKMLSFPFLVVNFVFLVLTLLVIQQSMVSEIQYTKIRDF